MAESVVSFVVERLGGLLIHEAVFLHGVSDQVLRMQTEMQRMKCFLKDADAKEITDDRVRNWVAEIRDAAYDAEDVIDTFILEVCSRRRGGLKNVLKRYVCIFNEWIHLHKVGTKIEAIQAKILGITNSLQTYGIRSIDEGEGLSSTNENQREWRRSYPHIEEEDVIGLEKDTEALVEVLKKEKVRFGVVSIVGMGGLGKTTLAKKVYNHDVIKCHFGCTAWVFISQQFRRRDVIQGILKRFVNTTNEEMEKMKEDELVEKLYKFLQEKRYLVVLDDIWSTDAWDRLRPAFPNGKTGSKIMLTTRNKEVAVHADPHSDPHELRFLNEKESWELLCNKAFPNTGCPPGFERFKREIVAKCGGLPLVVVVVGGLLAKKKSLNEWEMVLNNISPHLNKGKQEQVLGILALSYNDLPYHLKPCFLYLGMFPEDFSIPIRRLIRLWIAEGFVSQLQQEARGEKMEEIAEQYLAELIHRGMVQAGERNYKGNYKTCRIHDLMRDLCLLKAKEENFLEIFNQGNMVMDDSSSIVAVPSLATAKSRRYAIHLGDVTHNTLFQHGTLNLRSLLSFDLREGLIKPGEDMENFLHRGITSRCFQLLRVLDLERVFKPSLNRVLGKLINLRYLGLRWTFLDTLPSSLGKLKYLQTLDVKHTYVNNLPSSIWEMRYLRHLHLNNTRMEHARGGTMQDLQTIRGVLVDEESQFLARPFFLRELELTCRSMSKESQEALLAQWVEKLVHLGWLKLRSTDDSGRPSTLHLESLSALDRLYNLYMVGKLERLFGVHEFPQSLRRLTLSASELTADPFPTLEKLPNLITLDLFSGSYTGTSMVCSSEGFPQLQELRLWNLQELKEWTVEKGAMPCIRKIEIKFCNKLEMLPDGLHYLDILCELKLTAMPGVFTAKVENDHGQDRYKIPPKCQVKVENVNPN
ncbi:hypothetical protein HHK36_026130 [Tetracentron sinense]|uniref:Uncharacterized protein n=1 Tax=Tetracentron sinense TaxID=13715 RepID=A0A834YK16_TETSI|nr:hypothetical protein HHK36_026130 [Tetracentron sinense]